MPSFLKLDGSIELDASGSQVGWYSQDIEIVQSGRRTGYKSKACSGEQQEIPVKRRSFLCLFWLQIYLSNSTTHLLLIWILRK